MAGRLDRIYRRKGLSSRDRVKQQLAYDKMLDVFPSGTVVEWITWPPEMLPGFEIHTNNGNGRIEPKFIDGKLVLIVHEWFHR